MTLSSGTLVSTQHGNRRTNPLAFHSVTLRTSDRPDGGGAEEGMTYSSVMFNGSAKNVIGVWNSEHMRYLF